MVDRISWLRCSETASWDMSFEFDIVLSIRIGLDGPACIKGVRCPAYSVASSMKRFAPVSGNKLCKLLATGLAR
jgi:hypothetical protein